MRPRYSTITPSVVHSLARSVLEATLQFQPYKHSVTVAQLLDLLLLTAAGTRTLFAVVTRCFGFSHETARRSLHHNLPTLDALTDRLVDALHAVAAFSRRDRRRAWNVAIDTHNVPYYGSRATPHIVGGQKKQGTGFFHCYATAVLTHKRRRYAVGLRCVEKGLKPHQQVEALLAQVTSRGLRVGGVVLDSGFDSGDTILLLQERGVSFTVPLRRKGNAPNRRNACFSRPGGSIETVEWTTEESRKPVAVRVLVWQQKTGLPARVYAFSGWGGTGAVSEARRARLGRRRYRERFGIETSYRQKNQGRGWTTSGRAEYRLLLEGLAMVLRQVWVRLSGEVARARGLAPKAWVSELRLVEVLVWLADAIRAANPGAHGGKLIDLARHTLTTTETR